jgi:hypothetical protein
MKNKISKIIILALVISFVSASLFAQPTQAAFDPGRRGPGNTSPGASGNRTAPSTTAPASLSDEEAADLQQAILEEYMAMNTYQAVLDTFGSQVPFSRIVRAEQQHTSALIRVAERYGVEVPENTGEVIEATYTTLAEACQMGVDLEIADAALYDELMAKTTNSALIRVYTRLQAASLNNHLPAFEACAD